MRSNRRRDTAPELRIRSELFRRRMRFRVDYPITVEPRSRRPRPDIAFPKQRVAVFVDGCFWHGCELHCDAPKSNRDYWEPKIRRNRQRDAETNELLVACGWTVVRVWEHETPAEAANRIQEAVAGLSGP